MRRVIVIGLIALLMPFAVLTQGEELPGIQFFPSSGIQIRHPEHWQTVTDAGAFYFQTDEVFVTPNWYFPASFEQFNIVPDDISTVMIRRFFATDPALTFDPDAIETVTIAGIDVFIYEYTDEDDDGNFENLIVARELRDSDGAIVAFFVIDMLSYAGPVIPSEEREAAIMVIISAEQVGPAAPDAELINRYNLRQTGMIINTPAGWVIEDHTNNYDIVSAYTRLTPFWFFPASAEDLGLSPDDLTSVFEYMANLAFAEPLLIDADDIQQITVDDSTFLIYDYVDEDENGVYEGLLAAKTLEDNTIFAANIFPPISSSMQERGAALRVFASVRIERAVTADDVPLTTFIDIDAIRLPYPEHWNVEFSEEGFIRLFSDFVIIDPYIIAGAAASSTTEAVIQLMESLNTGIEVQPADVQVETIDDVEIASTIYNYPTASDNAAIVAARLESGDFLLLDVYRRFNEPVPGEELTVAQRMLAAAASSPAD